MGEALQNPIVFSKRSPVKDALREELKGLGATAVILVSNPSECIENLIEHPDSIFVLDWDLGSEDVNQVLAAVKGHFPIETRPVLLISSQASDSIVPTAYEYGVSQVYTGEISRQALRQNLQALMDENEATRDLREILIKVAEARSRQDWSTATRALRQAWSQDPNQERVAVELAENLINEEDWDEAEIVLKPFLSRQPPVLRVLNLMGRILMKRGDFDAAVGYLQRARIINPHNVDRLVELGHALVRTEQLEEAGEVFDEALRLDKNNQEAAKGKGQCLLMSGEVNEGLGMLKEVSGPREMASIFNTAAVLSMRAGQFDKGMFLYKAAVAALGKDPRICSRLFFNMGIGFKRVGKSEPACRCFDKAVELDPSNIKAKRQRELTAISTRLNASTSDSTLSAKTSAPASSIAATVGGGSLSADKVSGGLEQPSTEVEVFPPAGRINLGDWDAED